MTNPMRVLFLISGLRTPASRFRVLQYVPELERLGIRCVVSPARPAKYESYRWLGWRLSQSLRRWLRWMDVIAVRFRRYDVVFIERELFDDATYDLELRVIESARASALDVDDAIHLRYPEKFAAVAKGVTTVLAGNSLLEEAARAYNSNVVLLPTVVDTDRYRAIKQTKPTSDVPVVGWTGTSSNLVYLQELSDVFRRVAADRPFTMQVIVNDSREARELDLGVPTTIIPWNEVTELTGLADMDVGLMPLPDDPWCRHKCGLKLLQYLAAEIPAIASPVGVNAEIIEPGVNGLLARDAEEWDQSLRMMLADAELRRRMGVAGRQKVEAQYSVKAMVPRLAAALREAEKREGGTRRGGRG